MMKKAVPLSLILATCGVQGQNYFSGTWVPSTTSSVNSAPQVCCYYSSNVVIGGTGTTASAASVTGTADTATGSSSATGTVGPCGRYMTSQIVSGTWTQTLDTATVGDLSVDNTVGPNTAIQTAGATFSVDSTGQTLTFKPSANDATVGTVCNGQTLTRLPAQTTVSTLDGTWSGVAGTGSGTCCYFDVAQNLVVTTVSSKTSAVGKNGATNCASNGGNGATTTVYLKTPLTGSAAATAGATATDLGGVTTWTLSNNGNTLTYVPGTNCQQVFTKVPSSSANKLAAMTPVVVGAAVLGLVVV